MRKSRFDESQIVGILRAADSGRSVQELCREHGISRETFKRWRTRFGRLEVADAERLGRLEEENRRLKRALEDLTLDNRMLRGVVSRTVVSPEARREAVSQLRESFGVSERRACRTLGTDRSSVRYRSGRGEPEELARRIGELATRFPREGYRSQTRRLREEGHVVNAKRVLRLRRKLGIEAERQVRSAETASGRPKVVRWASLRAREGERPRR